MPASLMATGLLLLVAPRVTPSSFLRRFRANDGLHAGVMGGISGRLEGCPLGSRSHAGLVIVLMPQGRSKEGEDAPTVSTLPRMPWWLRPVAVVGPCQLDHAGPDRAGIWASGQRRSATVRGRWHGRPSTGGAAAPGNDLRPRSGGWIVPAIAAIVAGVGIVVVTSAQCHRPDKAGTDLVSYPVSRACAADRCADLHAEAAIRSAPWSRASTRMEHHLADRWTAAPNVRDGARSTWSGSSRRLT